MSLKVYDMSKALIIMVLSSFFLVSCRARAIEGLYDYKKCIVEVKSPISQNGFGIAGADWIASHMIQDNIKNNRRIKYLPGMTKISDDGFYFYFYETCSKKMDWAKLYIENFIASHEGNYHYKLKSLSPKEVDSFGIQEIKKF